MEVKIKDVMIGADPELFVRALTKDHPFVGAEGLIPGTKKDPHPIEGGAVQVDGMAVEYNINPAKTVEEFLENNKKVLVGLSKMLPDYQLINKPLAVFSDDVWAGASEEAKELGCDPDLNPYKSGQNPAPDGSVKFRTAAGHIHIGWTKDANLKDFGHTEACKLLAKELDIYLGAPSLWIDNSKESQQRRELYGQAGAYRVKPYGMEYRVLSNFWVGNETLMAWVFNNAKLCFERLLNNDYRQGNSFDAARIINGDDEYIEEIPYFCEQYKIPLPKI